MKKFVLGLVLITMCFVAPINAFAIGDGGTLSSPTFLTMGDSSISSEKTTIKLKDGKITAQFVYTIDNSTGGVSSIVIAIPKQSETALGLLFDKKPIGYSRAAKSSLISEFSGTKLGKFASFNTWRLEIGAGSTHEITISYNEKYTKGKNLTLKIAEDMNNADRHNGSAKVILETQKMVITDIGSLYVGNSTEDFISTVKTGKATWTGEEKTPGVVIKFKSTREELISILKKSLYKYPQNISAAMTKGDYKLVQSLSAKYIAMPAQQDPKLNIGYVKYALAEAAYTNKDFAAFETSFSDMDYLKFGSDQLTSRMAVRNLQYAQSSKNSTLGESVLQAFKTEKPEEFARIKPILEAENIIDKAGDFIVDPSTAAEGNPTSTPTPAAVKGADNTVKDENGFFKSVAGFFSKLKLEKWIGLIIAFILGIVVGFFFAKRRYRGSTKRGRTVYIG